MPSIRFRIIFIITINMLKQLTVFCSFAKPLNLINNISKEKKTLAFFVYPHLNLNFVFCVAFRFHSKVKNVTFTSHEVKPKKQKKKTKIK